MKTIIALFVLLLSVAQAAENNYYPQFFIDEIAGKVSNDALKAEINKVLTSTHQKDAKGGRDTLGCADVGSNGCYEHVVLGYNGARKVLFGSLHIEKINGAPAIRDVYCHKIFSASAGVKPGAIPNSNQLNCEHTWPQSKFSRLYPAEMQKSDLHHLFPTDSRANSIRGNYDFSDISSDNGELEQTNCGISKFGTSATSSNGETFEPPMEHKGNVARALFYFSVKYKISIPKDEEATLRRWNDLDPVDDAEMARNDAIAAAQGTRNPFIDFPQLVNYINRF